MAGFKLALGSKRKGAESMKSKKSGSEKGVTLLAANTEVTGDIHFVNQLYINGHVKGNVIGAESPFWFLIRTF